VIDAFVEGVRSLGQVCHLVILAPVALTIVAARGRWYAVVGAVSGVVLGGWLFVTNRFGAITDLELRVSALMLIALVLPLGFPGILRRNRPSWARRLGRAIQSPVGTTAITAAVGVLVVQWWRPCVGVELGAILTNAPDDPVGELLPTIGFMVGICVPLVVLGLIYALWKPTARTARVVGRVGAASAAGLAVSVLAGQHGEIVSRLFQWSQ